MRTWIIGIAEDCDIVVAQPRVSRRHCRFTELADGYLIEDLGSSNGTYVNGERIAAGTRVSAGDRITLGALVPMPWPPASARQARRSSESAARRTTTSCWTMRGSPRTMPG